MKPDFQEEVENLIVEYEPALDALYAYDLGIITKQDLIEIEKMRRRKAYLLRPYKYPCLLSLVEPDNS